MHSKKSGLLLSHLIIILSVTLLALVADNMLQTQLSNVYLRWGIILLGTALLYLFLAPSVMEPFWETEARLKEMIDQTLHELNTPLATIKANIAMLKRGVGDPKALQRLERIEEAAGQLTQLYESIEYDIKENIEHIEKTRFALSQTIDSTIRKFDDIRGDIEITNRCPDMQLFSDPNGFSRMLDNLLSNAIKYNRPGGFVKFYMRGNRLCIEDSGIGIDTKNLFIVYEKSFQENPTTEGFGLGLSIVKNFCDREHITIKIDTKKGVGTTIMLDLTPILLRDK